MTGGSGSSGAGGGPARPPTQVRVAAVIIGLEGLLGLGYAGYVVVRTGAASLGVKAALGQAGMFLLIGAAVLVVAVGLLRGRFWARTPAIVVQAMLLPGVFSLLGPSRQVLAGLLVGAVVVTALAMLLGAPARRWSEGLDEARRDG